MFRRVQLALVRRTWIAAGFLAVWPALSLLADRPPQGAAQAQPQPAAPVQSPVPATLPSGIEVSNRHVEAIGGANAVRALTSWRARGTFELSGQGISGDLEVLAARPASSLVRVELEGLGTVQSGYDGKYAWTLDPVSGPALVTGLGLTQAAEDAMFESILHGPESTKSLTTIERTKFDGHQAYKVQVVFVSGREEFEYFDVDTGLKLGSEGARETPNGRLPTVTFTRNYEPFGAMRQATEIVQQMLGIEQVVRITSYEYNVVEPAAFAPPPAIQALIKR